LETLNAISQSILHGIMRFLRFRESSFHEFSKMVLIVLIAAFK
jgi:hypothetical protein